MITAGALLLFGLAAGTWGATWLSQAEWPHRAPLMGIVAWHALTLNVFLAAAVASLALAFGLPELSMDLAGLIDTCAQSLRGAYSTPTGRLGSLAGISLLTVLGARLTCSALATAVRTLRERRRRTHAINVLGHHNVVPGVTILDHETAYAFCVPGRHRRIVLTSATLETLDHDQLRAVLAHERAHLRGRHHLMLSLCRTLANAFGFVPAFRLGETQVALLVELMADDAARRLAGAGPLGRALGSLSRAGAPGATLAASAYGVERRINRLSGPLRPLRGTARLATLAGIALSLALPMAVLLAPAVAGITEALCLIA